MERLKHFLKHLKALYPVNTEFSEAVQGLIQIKRIKKGEELSPTRPASVWYIHKGLVKGYYDDPDGKQHITRFWKEKDVILMMLPMDDGLQATALEDCQVAYLSGRKLLYLYNHFSETAKLSSKILAGEQSRSHLKIHLSALNATAAYKQFKDEFPFERILLKDTASYLEVTPGTLSEIRKMENKNL
jgi:CRP-like cAMP-binding protein